MDKLMDGYTCCTLTEALTDRLGAENVCSNTVLSLAYTSAEDALKASVPTGFDIVFKSN